MEITKMERDKTKPENMTRLVEFDRPFGLATVAFSIISRHDSS